MFAKLKASIVRQFLGDAVLETRKVYQSDDGKSEVFLGLYRKGEANYLYFKVVSRALMACRSSGVAIEIPSFGWLTSELDAAVIGYERGTLPPHTYPKYLGFLWRLILMAKTSPVTLLEFDEKHDKHRFIAYYDRKNRAVVSYGNRNDDIYFDYAGFVAMRDELLKFAGL